jgi:hypothetical protein
MAEVRKLETKGLSIRYFDALARENLPTPPLTYKNTVAEYLFAGSTFTLSPIPKKCKPDRLEGIEGKKLQFSNGNKAYFSDTGTEREAIFPIGSDGAAYGSIPFTECRNFHEVAGARVAIIDDTTGENPFGLEPAEAKRLVGDCYGKIDRSLHAAIGGEENTPFQFRIGVKPDTTTPARIAKGTLSPDDLSTYGVDLVMAKSSFKGRKGKANGEVEVGIHDWTTGIGIKTHAYRGEQALGAQILVNYPKAIEALIPLMNLRLNELREIATDPVRLATDYVDTIHRRYRQAIARREDFKAGVAEEGLTEEELDERLEEAASAENEERFYRIIKADLEGHRQLLEHPAVVRKLNDHLRKQYVEVATGRSFKFEGALLQPSDRLKDDEFCDPSLPDGAKVLVTRSPFLNSNNLIELTNRHLEEVKHRSGVVFMNPDTAAKGLQADFDGDRVAFAAVPERVNRRAPRRERLRQEFLIALADEVREKHKSKNRYTDVIKKAKVPYTGTFPEIAVSASENKIGTISRAVMKTIAMENEIDYIPEPEREGYLKKALASLKPLADKSGLFDKWLGDAERDPDYHAKMLAVTASLHRSLKTIAGFDKDGTLSTDEKLKVVKGFLHELVGVLGNELQVAVDGPKSALRPDKNVLDTIGKLTGFRDILWLDDYKSPDLYLDKPMRTGSYSPIDRMATLVNAEWERALLQPRKTQQFRPLFADVPFTDQQKERMERYKAERNGLLSVAFRLKKDAEKNPGPRAVLVSPSGREIEIVGIETSDHPLALKRQPKPISIARDDKRWERYVVLSPVPGKVDKAGEPLYLTLGYLSDTSAKEHRETLARLIDKGKGRAELGTLRVERLTPGIGKDEVSAAFDAVREFDTRTRESLPPEDIPSLASALWSLVHARTSGTEESKDSDYREATVAFALFSPEIQTRLDTLQFKELTVGEFRLHEHRDRRFAGESHPVRVDFIADPNDPNHNSRVVRLEDKILGPLSDQSPHLPVGTTASASLHTPLGAGAIASLPDGATFKIGSLKNYPHALTDFRGLETSLTIDRLASPGKAPVFVARLDGHILGEIRDKDSKELLSKRSLLREQIEIAVRLDRESPSIVRLDVDPATVVYPDRQLHDRARSTPERSGDPLPTLWCRSDNGLTLAVDHRNRRHLADFLDRHNLPFSPVEDAGLEREAGYTVVGFEGLPEPVYNKLVAKFGEPSSEDDYLRRVEEAIGFPSSEPLPEIGAPDGRVASEKPAPYLLVPAVGSNPGANANRIKDGEMAALADAESLQNRRTVTVAPILMDILHCKFTDEYHGEKYTVIFDPESQLLSGYRSDTRELMMQARYTKISENRTERGSDNGWKPLPILLSDPKQPNIRREDVDFLTGELAPKLVALWERHSQIYADALRSLNDQEYLVPVERDRLIAVSLLKSGCALEEVALTIARSDTFRELTPSGAGDYRRKILENAVELHEEARRDAEIEP